MKHFKWFRKTSHGSALVGLLLGVLVALALNVGAWDFRSPKPDTDGRWSLQGALVNGQFDQPCVANRMVGIMPVLTPGSCRIPPDADTPYRDVVITNPGSTKLRFRRTRDAALPADWATVYEEVAATSTRQMRIPGFYLYLHTWTSGAETLTSSAEVCWPGTYVAYVPSPTPTATNTPGS